MNLSILFRSSISPGLKPSIGLSLFLALFLLLYITSQAEPPVNDGAVLYRQAENLAVSGSFDFGYHAIGYSVKGTDGRHYGKFNPGGAIVHVPGAFLSRVVEVLEMDAQAKELHMALMRNIMPSILGALTALFFFMTLRLFGTGSKKAIFWTFVYLFGTFFWNYARDFYSEVLQVFAFNGALYFAVKYNTGGKRIYSLIFSGIFAGIAVLTKTTFILFFPIFLVYLAWRKPVAEILKISAAFALASLPFLSLTGYYNYIRFGEIFTSQYGEYLIPLGFHTPLFTGLYGLLVSTGRGFIWYAMPAVISLFGLRNFIRENRREFVFFSALSIIWLLFHAKWSVWHGAETWGPRFLLPCVSLALIPASAARFEGLGGRIAAIAAAVLIAVSFAVQASSAMIHYPDFYRVVPYKPYSSIPLDTEGRPLEPVETDNLYMVNFVPEFSPIAGHLYLLKHAVTGDPDLVSDYPWKRLNLMEPRVKQEKISINLWFVRFRDEAMPIFVILMIIGILSVLNLVYICKRFGTGRSQPGA
ncbi:MAG: glycosyltransferase family 39 protein [Deltaproteobacteria bacterium]|nr:glycosyltransferase family 39 protein [Deltaproteobacteria bacterium]